LQPERYEASKKSTCRRVLGLVGLCEAWLEAAKLMCDLLVFAK